MITRPNEIDPALEAAVAEGKRITFYYSPNTTVAITSTDAAEAQQLLLACQPVEDEEAPAYIMEQLWLPIMECIAKEPERTRQWLTQLLQLTEEA